MRVNPTTRQVYLALTEAKAAGMTVPVPSVCSSVS
jgi:hypothetical protein